MQHSKSTTDFHTTNRHIHPAHHLVPATIPSGISQSGADRAPDEAILVALVALGSLLALGVEHLAAAVAVAAHDEAHAGAARAPDPRPGQSLQQRLQLAVLLQLRHLGGAADVPAPDEHGGHAHLPPAQQQPQLLAVARVHGDVALDHLHVVGLDRGTHRVALLEEDDGVGAPRRALAIGHNRRRRRLRVLGLLGPDHPLDVGAFLRQLALDGREQLWVEQRAQAAARRRHAATAAAAGLGGAWLADDPGAPGGELLGRHRQLGVVDGVVRAEHPVVVDVAGGLLLVAGVPGAALERAVLLPRRVLPPRRRPLGRRQGHGDDPGRRPPARLGRLLRRRPGRGRGGVGVLLQPGHDLPRVDHLQTGLRLPRRRRRFLVSGRDDERRRAHAGALPLLAYRLVLRRRRWLLLLLFLLLFRSSGRRGGGAVLGVDVEDAVGGGGEGDDVVDAAASFEEMHPISARGGRARAPSSPLGLPLLSLLTAAAFAFAFAFSAGESLGPGGVRLTGSGEWPF
uniref:Uncharacterized protein n=1 Tax=Setaria italica TaxID=4555 RepID=K3Y6N1_SETIT